MREILFRGKRVDNGEWVYGSLVNNLWEKGDEEFCEIVTTDVDYYDCWEDLIFEAIVEVIPETVGQFTGLLDKNGDRIFEGDIVICETNMRRREEGYVCFNDGSFYLAISEDGYYILQDLHNIEITGNIHNN